jgi:UDP-glucose 4-epimerase
VISWVVGRGLLGAGVARSLATLGPVWASEEPVRWDRPPEARAQLAAATRQFCSVANGQPWQLAWCAGLGVPSASAADLGHEVAALHTVLSTLRQALGTHGRSPTIGQAGVLFLASSVGGVYAGSRDAPFDEDTQPAPLTPYGHTRLEQEALVRSWAEEVEVSSVIGRITNLFGPDQNTAKRQGLISQLVKAALLRQPTPLYVPLDTVRDYLFGPDAARLVTESMALARTTRGRWVTTKIVASQRPTTVASILAEVRRVLKRPPKVVLMPPPPGMLQPASLSARSIVWTELDHRPQATLAEGIHAVASNLALRFACAGPGQLEGLR